MPCRIGALGQAGIPVSLARICVTAHVSSAVRAFLGLANNQGRSSLFLCSCGRQGARNAWECVLEVRLKHLNQFLYMLEEIT